MSKIERYHPLAQCESCPLYMQNTYVPSQAPSNSNGMAFVGEAPGKYEVKRGKPFIGASGKLLDEVLKHYKIKRTESLLTNTVSCRPSGNAEPPPEAITACSGRLAYELSEVDATTVVAFGVTASSALLDRPVKITRERAGPPKKVDGKPYQVIPTIHPAACLRVPDHFPDMVNDVGKVSRVYVKWEPPKYKVFDTPGQAAIALTQLRQHRNNRISLDLEVAYGDKDENFAHPDSLLAAGFAYDSGLGIVIGEEALRSQRVRTAMASLLREKEVIYQNAKYDTGVLHRMGIGTFRPSYDTMLASYAMDERPGHHGLKMLLAEHLGYPPYEQDIKGYKRFVDIPRDKLYRYNAYDAVGTYDLEDYQRNHILDATGLRLHDFLLWASHGLMLIESDGIWIDQDALAKTDKELTTELDRIAAELGVYEEVELPEDSPSPRLDDRLHWGRTSERIAERFNPNSWQQVTAILAALGVITPSTDKDHLTPLASRKGPVGQFASTMLEWRHFQKLHGTYVEGIKRELDFGTGRLRTTFNLHRTTTGRLSSTEPNVQNPPRQGGIRELYSAEPGKVFVYADYGNIEGRIVCTLARSESMRQRLDKLHDTVAEAFYGPNFDKEQRTLAKSVVHGVNYVRTPKGISEGLGVSLKEATGVHDMYHNLFPEIRPWQASIRHKIFHEEADLETPWGRRRRFGLITRQNAEDIFKEGVAFEPQSTGSDICLTAGIRLKEQGVPVRVLIHDGILAEVPQAEARMVGQHMREVMEQVGREYTDYVPFPVDVEVGTNWGNVKAEEDQWIG